MTTIHAKNALLADGWAQDVRISTSAGAIAAVAAGQRAQPGDEIHDVVVPGMPNVHSHAFQRGMAGLAEVRGTAPDSFWSWRELMYKFALAITPEQMQTIATWLYIEMLEAGFTRVGEFHYLHHRPDGGRYDDIGQMTSSLAEAAQVSGISLSLLPVLYTSSGFGKPPKEEQRRFTSSIDDYARLLDRCETIIAGAPNANLGVAPHSLRAVARDELSKVVEIAGHRPIHIHIAEQTAEVDDCVSYTGHRPVEWLLKNHKVDERWCLIHATHVTVAEIQEIARAGAVVGLCPITEANLGDGIFPGHALFELKGNAGIGSDSNILLDVAGELRQLEYSQRLERRQRNVMARGGRSTGRELFDWAAKGGERALQSPYGIRQGVSADFVSLRQRLDLPVSPDQWLDMWIFSGGVLVDCVWVGGRKLVSEGKHVKSDKVKECFLRSMKQLLS
jgi:formiminoglutamate deiminase